MKKSSSLIFFNTEKELNNCTKKGTSINQSLSLTKELNKSTPSLKYAKIIYKPKNIKFPNIRYQDNNCLYNNKTNNSHNSMNLNKDYFKIFHKNKKDNNNLIGNNNTLSSNSIYNKNINENTTTNSLQSLSSLYYNYNFIINKNHTNYDKIFYNKIKMTNYRKSLSSDYEKNNLDVIDMIGTKYKQKTDSILNVVENKDGFYIKGLRYKKYYFFPHKKMNILSFHHNIISKNIKKIEKDKIEALKNIKSGEKIIKKNKFLTDNHFLNVKISKKERKKLRMKRGFESQQKIEEIINEEVNNVINNIKEK